MKILMHEPAEELFLGVIHPDAALFADYFNVDQASKEHRNYREELCKAGAEVVTVSEILVDGTLDAEGNAVEGPALDQLREFAAQFLTYNTDAVPDERAHQERYKQEVLRKANPKDLLRIILLQPEIVLSRTQGNTGFAAVYKERPMMNLFYMRDQMIATFKGIVIARMHSPQREVESRVAEFCLNKIGMPPVGRIAGEGAYLEGGDFLPFGEAAFIGCGLRTTQKAIDQLMENDWLGTDKLMVVHDRWLEQEQMHLDTYFNCIDRDLVTLSANRYKAGPDSSQYLTVDVYERSNGGPYRKTVEGACFVEYLEKTLGVKVIPISRPDELNYANNYLTIAPRRIMVVAGQSQELQQAFADNGVNATWIPLANLTRGYGAAHCMTQILTTEPVF